MNDIGLVWVKLVDIATISYFSVFFENSHCQGVLNVGFLIVNYVGDK